MSKKYIAPVIILALTVLCTIAVAALMAVALAQHAMSAGTAALMLGGPVIGAVLIIVAVVLRLREIKGGEEDAARKY